MDSKAITKSVESRYPLGHGITNNALVRLTPMDRGDQSRSFIHEKETFGVTSLRVGPDDGSQDILDENASHRLDGAKQDSKTLEIAICE